MEISRLRQDVRVRRQRSFATGIASNLPSAFHLVNRSYTVPYLPN